MADTVAGIASGRKDDPSGFRIGYALSAKKAQSFLRKELIEACEQRDVLFVPIDRTRRLVEAGDFDAILHKDSSPDWAKQLEEYQAAHPSCILIDHPERILPLHNRLSMLECVDDDLLATLHSASPSVVLKVPHQISITDINQIQELSQNSSMKFPLVAKPLVADGSAESHKMFLVLNPAGLQKLSPPVVVQEFINHGGVIFKVYVVGDSAICTPRRSLQDCSEGDLEDPQGLIGFSQISNLLPRHSSDAQPRAQGSVGSAPMDSEVELSSVELPSEGFVKELSTLLRERLHLTLFNYDLIQDTKTHDYYIVDINYFPGFAKMPSYLSVLSSFFAGLTGQPREQPKS